MFVLITQNCSLGIGASAFGGGNQTVGGAGGEYPGFFTVGDVLNIPPEWFDPACMTRTGPVPGPYSLGALTNPYSAALIPWSTIGPGAAPLNNNEFAELVAFDPKYGECAMRGPRELHAMVTDMRFQSGTYWRNRALLEADRLKSLRLEGEEIEASLRCRHWSRARP